MIPNVVRPCALFGGLLVIAACERPRDVPSYSIQEFLGTTSYVGASFSPDNGKVLVSSNATGIFNAVAIDAASGTVEPLTTSTDESVFAIGYFPDDERFLYSSDQGGNELRHIYVRELDGSVTDLTPGEGHLAQFAGWSPDRTVFYIQTNERDRRYMDLYQYAVGDYTRTMMFENNEGFGGATISPDGQRVALAKIVSNADSDIYVHDRSTGTTELLTPDDGDVQYTPQAFSPDGASLYYLTDRDSEFMYLERHHLATGERGIVEKPDWDVMFGRFSRGGKYLVTGVNNDARTELKIRDAQTLDPIVMPEVPEADITGVTFASDETQMAFYASSSRMPQDLFVYDFDGGEPRQLTSSLNPNVAATDLVEGQVVRFASYDGVEIPGILYRPHQAARQAKVPALVWVHGGPGGQSRVGYSGLIQYLVNHGYAVYAINNRGSSGYGKTFFHLDDRKHGDADLDDVVAAKQMLMETGWVDGEGIGILGGSYGGYMVLAALTFRPEAFAAGVDLFGISNWHRTVSNIPPWWEAMRTALENEMGPFDDEEFFRAKSPLFHADNIVRPLMVLQGANDPRVLKVESDEIVAAVRANGVPVEYVLFEDEGHGFVKRENQEEGYEAILRFLDQHLKAAGPADR